MYSMHGVSGHWYAVTKETHSNLELLLDGLPERSDLGLDAVRELAVVFVQVPQ